eukprot:2324684-Prymnesium_polylepis.1
MGRQREHERRRVFRLRRRPVSVGTPRRHLPLCRRRRLHHPLLCSYDATGDATDRLRARNDVDSAATGDAHRLGRRG